MRKLVFIGLFAVFTALAVSAQSVPGTVKYPGSLDDTTSLISVNNGASTTLNGSINNSVTTITVVSTSAFPSSGIITIDSEIITYTGKNATQFTGCTRGADSTTAASHTNATAVRMNISRIYHTTLRDAIIATETKLGSASSTPTSGTVLQGTGSGTSAWSSLSSTPSLTLNLGSGSASSNTFDLTVSNAGSKPTLRFNGTLWQLSNDGSTFSTIGSGSSGLTSLNALTGATQTFAVATTGTDFAITSSGTTHTFAIPDASGSARGLVSTGTQTFGGNKWFTGGLLAGFAQVTIPSCCNAKSIEVFNQGVVSDNAMGLGVSYYGTGSTGPTLRFLRNRGNVSSPTEAQSGDQLGKIHAGTYDGTNLITSGAITFEADGSTSTNTLPTAINFYTTATNGIGTKRAGLASNGNFTTAFTSGGTAKAIFYTDASVTGSTFDLTSLDNNTIGMRLFGTATQLVDVFQAGPASGTIRVKIDKDGWLKTNHLIGNSSAPTIAAGTGAGTGPTISVSGTDLSGYISLTTGSSPSTSATVATITFNTAYAATPKTVILTPGNANASALSGNGAVYASQADTSTTVFLLKSGSSALAGSTAYIWHYLVIQ